MSVQMVRFSTDAQRAHEVEEAIATLFTAVAEAAPAGVTYTAGRVGDGGEAVAPQPFTVLGRYEG